MSVFDSAVKQVSSLVGITSKGQATKANSLPVVLSTNHVQAGKSAADYASDVFPAGAVRNDSNAASTTGNFQYTMLSADSTGRLKVLPHTLAADDAEAAGELFPAAGLYQVSTAVDEVDTGDIGRLRMTARRGLIVAQDFQFNQVTINNVATPGGIQCLTGDYTSASWVDPAAAFFDGSDVAFDAAPRYVRIPMIGFSQVVISLYHNLGTAISLTVDLFPLWQGYTGGDGILSAKLASVVAARTTTVVFSPQAGGAGSGALLFPVPALQMPMRWLLLQLTPSADPSSGYLLINAARS